MSPIYKREEIVAYYVGDGNRVVCPECITDDETISDVITEDEQYRGDILIVCDQCVEKC